MGRIRSVAGWAGLGGAAWIAGQAVEGRAFMKAAEMMNQQIEDDFDALGRTGRLTAVQPLFPLQGPLVASKPRIMARCLAGGCGVCFAGATAVAFPILLASHPRTGSPLAQAVFGALATGVGAALLVGWFVGLLLWIVFGTRENAKRSANVVVEHYRHYWAERQRAASQLLSGAEREAARETLWSYRIATEPDEALFGAGGWA